MSVVIIDNYDSFTYNLFQLIGSITKEEPEVVRNDAMTVEEIAELSPSHVVISPGPGRPDVERDFGVSSRVILELGRKVPVLGVCLGHQGIIHHLGGRVVRAPEIVHGKTSLLRHRGEGVFAGLPESIEVMRYHSLIGERSGLPDCLRVTAETVTGGIIMGVRHESWPLEGVQFHPESIGTPLGRKMLETFLRA